MVDTELIVERNENGEYVVVGERIWTDKDHYNEHKKLPHDVMIQGLELDAMRYRMQGNLKGCPKWLKWLLAEYGFMDYIYARGKYKQGAQDKK